MEAVYEVERLERQLRQLPEYRIEKNVTRCANEPVYGQPDYTYQYTVPLCVSRRNILVADIYDVPSVEKLAETIEKAYRDSLFTEDRRPFFVFFYCGGEWKGLSLFTKRTENGREKDCYLNSYGKRCLNSANLAEMDFSCAVDKVWNTDYSQVMNMINTFNSEQSFSSALIAGIKEQIENWFCHHDYQLRKSVSSFLERLDEKKFSFQIEEKHFHLSSKAEDELFMAVLGKVEKTELTRFTTLGSLAATLKSHKHRMNSIAVMNDKTECSYSQQYMRKGEKHNPEHKDDAESIELYFNNYITSFSVCDENDLTMWRLYGDDSKGVALVYEFDKGRINGDFSIAPVSYAAKADGKHETLDFVKFLLETPIVVCHRRFVMRRWKVWQRFFKSEKYALEQEVRLLYSPQVIPSHENWNLAGGNIFSPSINFPLKEQNENAEGNDKVKENDYPVYPLTIKKIWLGPNCPERETNKVLIKALLEDIGVKCEVGIVENMNYRAK